MQPDPTARPVHPPQGAGITDIAIPGITFKPAMQLPSDELAAFSGPASAAPLLSFNDPVTNPNLDFTGPIATVEPVARKFILPKTMSATFSGTAVPTPSGSLQQLITTLSSPPHQGGSDLCQFLAARLTSLPAGQPVGEIVNAVDRRAQRPISLADSSLERQPIGEFDLTWSLSTGQPANRDRRHQSSRKSDRIRPQRRWGRLLRSHDHRHPDHQVRRGLRAFRPSNWTTNGRHTELHRRSDCQLACPPLGYPRWEPGLRLHLHCRRRLHSRVAPVPSSKWTTPLCPLR